MLRKALPLHTARADMRARRLDRSRHAEEPYLEYRHPQIMGKPLRPRAMKAGGAELTFVPSIRMNAPNRLNDKPRAVGSLDLRDGLLCGVLSMPADALEPVMQMLIAGISPYVIMDGPKLRYRQCLLSHYRLEKNFD